MAISTLSFHQPNVVMLESQPTLLPFAADAKSVPTTKSSLRDIAAVEVANLMAALHILQHQRTKAQANTGIHFNKIALVTLPKHIPTFEGRNTRVVRSLLPVTGRAGHI